MNVSGVFLKVKLECGLNPEKYNAVHNVRSSLLPQYTKKEQAYLLLKTR